MTIEIDESQLTLEQRRQRNIERNHRFLEELNFRPSLAISSSPIADVELVVYAPKTLTDELQERNKLLVSLIECFPARGEQINTLVKYFTLQVS